MDRREQDRLRTRTAILDAAEALMREEGYAAVTSRRVAERAGLKSQLVYYHFGTMDELFQAAFRRNDQRFFETYLKALSSKNPIEAIWKMASSSPSNDAVILEYVAAANHRKVLRDELVQSWTRFAALIETFIGNYFDGAGIEPGEFTPKIMRFLITAVSKSLIEEENLDYTAGHDEVIAFMNNLIKSLQAQPAKISSSSRGKKGSSGNAGLRSGSAK